MFKSSKNERKQSNQRYKNKPVHIEKLIRSEKQQVFGLHVNINISIKPQLILLVVLTILCTANVLSMIRLLLYCNHMRFLDRAGVWSCQFYLWQTGDSPLGSV